MSGDFHHPETELEQISDMTKFMRDLNKQADAAKAREVLEVADKAPLNSPSLTGVPKAPTASANTNTTQIATTAFVMNALNSLINAAPETLRTLKALADALDNDPNFHRTIKSLINEKLPIAGGTITGGLTVNKDLKVKEDLTVVGKLHAIADYAPWSGVTGKPTTISGYGITDAPTKKGDGASGTWGINITGSSSSCTGNAATATNASKVGGFTVGCNVPANAKFTDTTYGNMTKATASTAGKAGLVPAPKAGQQDLFLCGNGTWAKPAGTTKAFGAATSSAAGSVGLVPAPAKNAQNRLLQGDATWVKPGDLSVNYAATAGTANTAKACTGNAATATKASTCTGNAATATTATTANNIPTSQKGNIWIE